MIEPVMLRQLDWVDRLAGVDSLAPKQKPWVGVDCQLIPEGAWLVWPVWRRLLDLIRARVQGHIMFAYLWLRSGRNACYADTAYGIYDIHLYYRFERTGASSSDA